VLADVSLVLDATEDAPLPSGAVGSLVSTLISGISDPDGASVARGIAVIAANTTNGIFYYSTNNGTSWTAFPAVSNQAALLLAGDADTRIYFRPATANFNGSLTSQLTIRAWDATTGSNGGSANTTAIRTYIDQFGTVAYNNSNGTATWTASWAETGDDNSASTGDILISGGTLRIGEATGGDNGNESISRTVDLANASGATTLSFVYGSTGTAPAASQALTITVSGNGTSQTWTIPGTGAALNNLSFFARYL